MSDVTLLADENAHPSNCSCGDCIGFRAGILGAKRGRGTSGQMKGSHTPGPWTAEAVMGDDPHDICGPDRPGEGCPNLLASVAYDEDDPLPHLSLAEANANARLIAAAPELLAACKAALLQMCLTNSPCNAFTDAVDALDAAIAKAEGKS